VKKVSVSTGQFLRPEAQKAKVKIGKPVKHQFRQIYVHDLFHVKPGNKTLNQLILIEKMPPSASREIELPPTNASTTMEL